MKNKDIRKALIDAELTQYQLAEILGVHPSTITRKLESDLSDDERREILMKIKKGE